MRVPERLSSAIVLAVLAAYPITASTVIVSPSLRAASYASSPRAVRISATRRSRSARLTGWTRRPSFRPGSVREGCDGTRAMTFRVDLSTPVGVPVTVNYATANGTATAGSDYHATSGSITFGPGQTGQAIGVSVIGDTIPEPNETFTVHLTGASPGVTILVPSATGTILNDD